MNRPSLPETIQTKRLVLRPWQFEDVDAVLGYAADEEWSRFLPVPYPYRREDAAAFIARQVLLNRAVHAAWAVTLNGVSIGGINIRMQFEHALAEMGWSIARAHWGCGFGTEASLAARDEAFRLFPDLNKIRAMADLRNVASHRVMEKLGMTKEGVLRQNRVFRGEGVDEVWYGILRSEWTAASG